VVGYEAGEHVVGVRKPFEVALVKPQFLVVFIAAYF
jgi:hypothetical protein